MNEEIADLQSRLAFQEETLQQFTLTVSRQQNELAYLKSELERLKEYIREMEANRPLSPGEEPPPPHY